MEDEKTGYPLYDVFVQSRCDDGLHVAKIEHSIDYDTASRICTEITDDILNGIYRHRGVSIKNTSVFMVKL